MIATGASVFLATQPVDFRKGPQGLMALVQESGANPFSGAVYVFRSKRADKVKMVWWDSGVCLFAKRLDEHGFHWPRIENSVIRLSVAQMLALLEGLDWSRVRAVPERQPTSVGRPCDDMTRADTAGGSS